MSAGEIYTCLHGFLLIAQRDRICWTPGGGGRSGARAAGYEGMQLKNALSSNSKWRQEPGERVPSDSLCTQEGRGSEQQHQACPFPKDTAGPPTHSLDYLEPAFWGRAWKCILVLAAALPVTGQEWHTSVQPVCRLSSLSNEWHKTKTQPGKELNASSAVETMGLREHEKKSKIALSGPLVLTTQLNPAGTVVSCQSRNRWWC